MEALPLSSPTPTLIEMAMDALAEGVLLLDGAGQVVYVNRRLCEGLRVPAERLIGGPWEPETVAQLKATDANGEPFGLGLPPIREALEHAETTLGFQYVVRFDDGARMDLVTDAVPIRFGDSLVGVVATFTDVTERVHAEQEARSSDARFRRVLETAHEGISVLGADGRATFVNAKLAEMLGLTVDDMLGRSPADFVSPECAPEYSARMQNRRKGISEDYELCLRHKEGHEVWVLASAAPMFDEKHRFEGSFAMSTDITEMKAAHRSLEETDCRIRQAYVDVLSAVTGGKLVLMTPQELTSALGEPVVEMRPLGPDTLAKARGRFRELMQERGTVVEPDGAIVAFGEAATNALKHAGAGWCGAFQEGKTLQLLVTDGGPGIDFNALPNATVGSGYSTTKTLGMGYTLMLDLSDRLLLTTQPGCTQLVLEFRLS